MLSFRCRAVQSECDQYPDLCRNLLRLTPYVWDEVTPGTRVYSQGGGNKIIVSYIGIEGYFWS